MTNLTRRDFVLAAAGGLGTVASSRLHAAQTAGPGEKAGAATGSPSGNDASTPVRAASASVKLTDDNMT